MDVELTNRNPEKFIPHPVLDDPTKMMRIIANPVYDRLTISRAAHIRKHNPAEYIRSCTRLSRPKAKSMRTPLKSSNNEPTITTVTPINNTRCESHSASRHQNPPPFRLPSPSLINRISSRNPRSSAHSRNQSIHSSVIDSDKKPIVDGTIRYVNSRHGFEIQRYSSPNWLSVDILSKDMCGYEEKTFREMIDKKEHDELLSRSIFTSEYYRNRWNDLLQTYRKGNLTHDQWAQQNYQLNCLKTFYQQASEREQYSLSSHEEKIRQRRSQTAFNQWKEGKTEDHIEPSRRATVVTSVLSSPSFTLPNNPTNRMSISSHIDNEFEELAMFRPMNLTKNTINTSYMLDEQRWSLPAMLKRVVGLADPLPPSPKIINHQSSLTNLSIDSGFESSP